MFYITAAFAAIIQTATVAQVGTHVITSREVQISAAINEVKSFSKDIPAKQRRQQLAKFNLPGIETAEFQKEMSQVVLEDLVQFEAENFSIGQVTSEKLKEDVAAVTAGLKDEAFWKSLKVTPEELELALTRKIRAQNFLKFKMDSSGLQITDDEARTYFEKNRVKFGAAPFVQFKDSIKQVLARQLMEEKLKDWFEVLKRKYRVRYLKPSGLSESKAK